MARNFPVPIYTNTATFPGLPANAKSLSTTSPGSTDSTRTDTGYALAARQTFLLPEQTANNTADTFPHPVGANVVHRGVWIFDPVGPIVPTVNDGFTVAAGTWLVPCHYSRTGGLTDGDVTNVTIQVQLARVVVNGGAATIQQTVGTGSWLSITITTTEASQTLSVSGVEAVFAPGEKLALIAEWQWPLQVALSGTARFHTNSATATRISAAPPFTIQYNKSLGDAAGSTDGIAREVSYARGLGDAAGAADALARVVTMPRALADSVPADDTLTRQAIYARALADAAPATDSLARQAAYLRALADSAALVDTLTRQAAYGRALGDSAGAVTDALTRIVTANRALADSAALVDMLTRQASYNRSLGDAAAASDMLTRQMIYARALQDNLSEGGGTTNIFIRPVFIGGD